ncbi:AAA family ATPase [Danxiaibacter flavus]|uniref:AAA family ATPase n=1 Tax=Danxiaibacter flavus TaxID=3049108 RepID=A0ABV3ZH32_9BACT|nr:AAA family ATPase [Chitinophagaceae bacterium DXS]
MYERKKIVVIGPESTGKSTLCELLASHYNTSWCAEYAREYLLTHERQYNYDDLLTIAKGQLSLEEKTSEHLAVIDPQQIKPLIIDTDMYVMKVWCEYVFQRCHQFILDQITTRKYDLYLLCNIDLPWVQDELREYPDEIYRRELFHIYKDLLINQQTPWVQINGSYEERLQTAISAIDKMLLV